MTAALLVVLGSALFNGNQWAFNGNGGIPCRSNAFESFRHQLEVRY